MRNSKVSFGKLKFESPGINGVSLFSLCIVNNSCTFEGVCAFQKEAQIKRVVCPIELVGSSFCYISEILKSKTDALLCMNEQLTCCFKPFLCYCYRLIVNLYKSIRLVGLVQMILIREKFIQAQMYTSLTQTPACSRHLISGWLAQISFSTLEKEDNSFHQQILHKFKEETSEVLYFEYSFVSCLESSERRLEIRGNF